MIEGELKKRVNRYAELYDDMSHRSIYKDIDEAKKEFPTYDSTFEAWKKAFPPEGNLCRIVDHETWLNSEREKWFKKWFGKK